MSLMQSTALALALVTAITVRPCGSEQMIPIDGRSATWSLADMIEVAERGVVVLEVETWHGTGQGSGFFVDMRHVVTNRHVIADARRAAIRLANGARHPVLKVVAEDELNDLALIEVDIEDGAGQRPLPVSSRPLRKGDDVVVLGAPRGLEFSASRGIVSAIRALEGMTSDRVIQIDASISPGNSGGPVLDTDGAVIGVASFGRRDGQGLNFAQGAWNVQRLIDAGLYRVHNPQSEP